MAQSDIQGLVFNIQHFSMHDGPGIRTLVFFKGCPLRCQWCSNPESQSGEAELGYDREKCLRCGSCLFVCPRGALSLAENGLCIDRSRCRIDRAPCVSSDKIGLIKLSVSEVTIPENAPPMSTPTAMSITFPRNAKSRNSCKNFFILVRSFPLLQVKCIQRAPKYIYEVSNHIF